MEFLTTFSLEKHHISWSFLNTTQFRVHGERFHMCYNQFVIYMGLYIDEFVESQDYHEIQVDFTPTFILAHYWRWINRDLNYESTRSKASTLESPFLRYIYKLLVHTINGRGDNTGVVSTKDLFYLHRMRERDSPHTLGHALT